jgi:hypothetical protein
MRKLAFASLFVLAGLIAPGSAHAAAGVEVIPPLGQTTGFAFPVVVAVQSQPITLVQLDGQAPHNFVAAKPDGDEGHTVLTGPDGMPWCVGYPHGSCPLFSSGRPVIGPATATVDLRNVTVGQTYDFFCSAHPYMFGQLRVVA